MKKGQIKINLADIFDMKDRRDADNKMLDEYHRQSMVDHRQSMVDHRKIKELEGQIEVKDKEIVDVRSGLNEVAQNPFLYVGRYFIASDDMDRVAEVDFNNAFKKFLETQFRKKK